MSSQLQVLKGPVQSVLICLQLFQSSAEMSGYLWKRASNAFKTWSLRYFKLEGAHLLYTHRDNAEDYSTFVGDLRLCSVKPVPSEPMDRRFCFELVTPARSYFLQAESEALHRCWVESIQAAIGYALNLEGDITEVAGANSHFLLLSRTGKRIALDNGASVWFLGSHYPARVPVPTIFPVFSACIGSPSASRG